MLSVAQDLVSQLTPYQQALNNALAAAASLPLAGNQLAGMQELRTIFQDSLSNINSQTQGIANNGHYQLGVPLPGIAKTFSFNLGLDALLQASASGNVHAAVTPMLNVGFNLQNGVVSLDSTQTNLDVGFDLTLPGFTGTFSLNGLLYTHAVDAGTDFHGDMVFAFDTNSQLTPHFSGDAKVMLGLTISFVDPATSASFNPTFKTTLDLDWKINPANNQMQAPTISLDNFSLDADSFLHGFLGDIVKTVQKFTKPIQPFIDIFETPVPILSAFDGSETIGSLFLKGAGSSQAQQDSFKLMIQIVSAVNAIDLSGSTGGAVIPFGTIKLTGNAQQAGAFGFDTSLLSGALGGVLSSPALQEVGDALKSVATYAGGGSTAGFKFPLLENPGAAIAGILSGHADTSLFSFTTGRQHFELAPTLGVGIPGVFGIFLKAGVVFDANLTMGYDTAGLVDLAHDPNHNVSHLLHGFYFDNSIDTSVPPDPNQPTIRQTGLYLHGLMALQADVFIAHASGGLYANVSVELVNTDSSSHVHLDTMIQNLGSGGRVFKLGGKVYASADLSLGLSLPIGPDITLFSFNLAYAELLNFDPPPPPQMNPPPVIHDGIDQQHTLLLEGSKMGVSSRVVTVQPFHNLSVNINGNTVMADGIRVDYPNELDLYVERADDVPRDYYNLIAVSADVPDGVSINVIDPFRMFYDEGVTNPSPLQTTSAVMLVAGKDVNYSYSEAADGTHPHVLLAGGYGLNTLTGGTMEFGNFIPSSYVAQAHAHFGNVSGFDAAGQNLINAQIANAVAPFNPSGIIGATMYASHGGLMVGGPGNNTFYALGPGAYEMVGGNWLNSFSISPSFNGVPATYQIDGGGGDSNLLVRVPAGDDADFESADVPDKYDPAYKALAIFNRQNTRFALAHGIKRVHAIAASGSNVVFGDTSELNIEFSVSGSAQVTFAGSPASDSFDVTSQGGFFNRKNHYVVDSVITGQDGSVVGTMAFPNGGPTYDIPVLSISRTFGTNGRTQVIPFSVDDPDTSHITLDGRGASDAYHIGLGLGSFLDLSVNDSDTTTRNSLSTDIRDLNLGITNTTLTDNSLKVQYRTQTDFLYILYLYGGTYYFFPPLPNGNFPTFGLYAASVFYSPTVVFSANVDVTFAAPYLHGDVTINRPAAPNSATIVIDGVGTSPPEYSGTLVAAPVHNADDIYGTPAPALALNVSINVHANAGNLSIQDIAPIEPTSTTVESNTGNISLSVTAYYGFQHTLDVLGNAGTLGVNFQDYGPYSSGYIGLIHTVNVLANTGTINLQDVVNGIGYGIDDQVNLGDNGSLANVRGTINFSNYAGHFGLSIDDRNDPSTGTPWTIAYNQAHVGNLVLNYSGINAPAPYSDIFSKLQVYAKVGSIVSISGEPPFYIREYNGVGGQHMLTFSPPAYLFNQDGDVINVSLDASSNLGLSLTYSASNLPPGLSLNPNTGVISGTIAAQDYLIAPYASAVSVSDGTFTRSSMINWYVSSAINIAMSFYAENTHEGETVTLDPITATNSYNRPVTLTVSNLPPGLSFNSNTGVISGAASAGSAQNSPYEVIVHATDGIESASTSFQWSVTGITLTVPSLEIGHVSDTVNLLIHASSSSGGTVTFAADNLPDGLTINHSTGVVSGVLNQNPGYPYYVTVTATQGADSQSASFYWTVLPAGVSNSLAITNPGMQTNVVGDYTFFYVLTTSSLSNLQYVPIAVTATGLPPGISFSYGESFYISGTIAPGAANGSPYHVTITATDGLNSAIANYNWVVATQNTVSIINPAAYSGYVYSTDGDNMNLQIDASSTLGHSLSYSASGLPTGLSINSFTGVISGTISPLAALPSRFDVSITASADTDSASTSFVWIVSSPLPNVVELPNPTGAGMVTITSRDGTSLSVSISATAGATPPGGITFPWGYITLTVTGIAPGGSADVIITPPNSSTTTDYFKYGPTPANSGNHWYDFLYQNQTDTDDASTTGAVTQAGGQIVLHLVDGLRGDDDLAVNGVISDIGAPAVMIPVIRGDFNRDGHVDGADISAMMRALVNLNAYRINNYLTPDDVITIADINGDRKVTNADLQALLNLLIGGGGSLSNGENTSSGTAVVVGIGDDSGGTAPMRPTAGSSMPSLLEVEQETESPPATAAVGGNAGGLIAPAAVIVNDAGAPAAVLPGDSNISDQDLTQSQPIIALIHTSNDRGPIANPASSPLSNGQEKIADQVSIRWIPSLLHDHRVENHWLSPTVRQTDAVIPVAPQGTLLTERENFYEQWKFDCIDILEEALGCANAASDHAQTDAFWSDVFALDDEQNDAIIQSHATFAEKN